MIHLLIINGPNLNLVGERQQEIYGSQSLDVYLQTLPSQFPDVKLQFFQSNIEGEIIDKIQSSFNKCDGIIINAGGYSHTSVAIADAIAAAKFPVLEVHISHIEKREPFRQKSLLTPYCSGAIIGLGLKGYELAIDHLSDLVSS